MLPDQEENQEDAQSIKNKIENTTLKSLVNSVKICFDPDDMNTLIGEDTEIITQFKEFENMLDNCGNVNKEDRKVQLDCAHGTEC